MFKSLIVKYAVDFTAKAIAAGTTIMVSKGLTTPEMAQSLANHATETVTILIALVATTGIKALNDNAKAVVKK